MKLIQVRKKILNIETAYHEGGEAAQTPLQIGVIAVVVNNPFAGRFADANELAEFVNQGRNLANEMVPELVAALGGVAGGSFGRANCCTCIGQSESPRVMRGPRNLCSRQPKGLIPLPKHRCFVSVL